MYAKDSPKDLKFDSLPSYWPLSKVLHNVLKVPDHLEYQLALLPSVSHSFQIYFYLWQVAPREYIILKSTVGITRDFFQCSHPPKFLSLWRWSERKQQAQRNLRWLPNLLHRIRAWGGRDCMVQSCVREQHPQVLFWAMGQDSERIPCGREMRVLVSYALSLIHHPKCTSWDLAAAQILIR